VEEMVQTVATEIRGETGGEAKTVKQEAAAMDRTHQIITLILEIQGLEVRHTEAMEVPEALEVLVEKVEKVEMAEVAVDKVQEI